MLFAYKNEKCKERRIAIIWKFDYVDLKTINITSTELKISLHTNIVLSSRALYFYHYKLIHEYVQVPSKTNQTQQKLYLDVVSASVLCTCKNILCFTSSSVSLQWTRQCKPQPLRLIAARASAHICTSTLHDNIQTSQYSGCHLYWQRKFNIGLATYFDVRDSIRKLA